MRIDTLAVISALAAGLLATTAQATTLHGFCSTLSPCTDNNTNTPTSVDPPLFGFSAGGQSDTGTVTIAFLVPDNDPLPASYIISGAFPGSFLGSSTFTATKFISKSGAWTSGDLDTYLGIKSSPSDPIGAFLSSTKTYDPTATGYYVFTANIGTNVTLPSNSGATNADLMTTNRGLLTGSYIDAFINDGGSKLGTNSNSGAIFEIGSPTPEPATWAMMLAGFGLVGAMLRRRARLVAA